MFVAFVFSYPLGGGGGVDFSLLRRDGGGTFHLHFLNLKCVTLKKIPIVVLL